MRSQRPIRSMEPFNKTNGPPLTRVAYRLSYLAVDGLVAALVAAAAAAAAAAGFAAVVETAFH